MDEQPENSIPPHTAIWEVGSLAIKVEELEGQSP